MSSDNFHLIVQLPNGKWKVSLNESMSYWQEQQNLNDYKHARKLVRPKDRRTFATLDEALDYGNEEGYTEYGEVVIQYENYYD